MRTPSTKRIPTKQDSLPIWLNYIANLHYKMIDLDLTRINKLAKILGLLNPASFVFTVAGTNGKGTTCATLEAILIRAGFTVGVYSSPHLLSYTERVRIQAHPVSEADFCQAFAFIESQRSNIPLTFFEFTTLAALQLFRLSALNFIILEVGLGGRLDATNIIDANVAAITTIALDHTDRLGNTLSLIGQEKAGVFRTNRPAIVGESNAPNSVFNTIKTLGALPYYRNKAWFFSQAEHSWCWQNQEIVYDSLPIPNIPALENAATAIAMLHYAEITLPKQAIISGLQHLSLAGRFQKISTMPTIIIDVAHNPHAATLLAKNLAHYRKNKHGTTRAVVGILRDKEIKLILDALKHEIDHWYCATLTVPRGAEAELLARYLDNPLIFKNVKSAFNQAIKDAHNEDIIIVFGSFHTVAEIMQYKREIKL